MNKIAYILKKLLLVLVIMGVLSTFIPTSIAKASSTNNEDQISVAKKIKKNNINLVLLEHTKLSKSIYEFNWNFPACIVVGNEVSGVTEELVSLCDEHVEIPMQGVKQSLNVSVAAGIIGYEILRYYNMCKQIRKK